MVEEVPRVVRRAGVVVAAEGALAISVAVVLTALGVAGHDAQMSFGTALWFVCIGGGVLAAGIALLRGRRWGRGVAVFANLLLLPVSWYMGIGSHRLELGIPVALLAITALALLFSPPALRWVTDADGRRGQRDGDDGAPASAASAGPDSR